MLESYIQNKIIKRYENDGWMIIKLIKTSKNGIPDLLCLKDGTAEFIEVKRPIVGKLSEIQKYRIKELQEKGFIVKILTE